MFRRLADDGRAEEALALARGEPLAGLDEEWVLAVRDDHRHILAEVLEALAQTAESGGDLESAVRFSRDLVRLDPVSEDAGRRLMVRLAASGDRPAALAAYERLRERLRRELSMAPSRATRELAETLREPEEPAEGAVATPPLPPPLRRRERSVLMGREAELERARELMKRSLEGDLQLTLISGEPGIGKSRLLGELCRAAHAADMTVLYGRCYEEPLGPYQPFAEALSEYLHGSPLQAAELGAAAGELARLSPRIADRLGAAAGPEADASEGARFRLFEAVVSLLEHSVRRGPVLIALDDLHWADTATLLLLAHLVRSSLDGLALAGAYRESELSRTHPLAATLADLRRDRMVERIALTGLDRGEVAGLVTSWVGPEAPGELSAAVHEETGGNPFFVEEVLRHLSESGGLLGEDGGWVTGAGVAELGIPEGVKEVIGRRLSRLSAAANRVLGAAAVAGRAFSVPVLERVEPLAGENVIEAVEEATAAQLVREEDRPGSYSFAHPLIHETLYGELSMARRVRLHAALAEALDAGDPELLVSVARHRIEAAGEGGRGRAAEAALAAARHDLGRLAYEEAADICKRALEVADRSDHQCQCLLVRGDALSRAGDLETARACFLEAAELARTGGAEAPGSDALARAALGFSGLGVTILAVDPEVVGLLREALHALRPDEHTRRAQLLSRLTIELYYGSTPGQRHELGRAAVEEATLAGDDAALADALGALHVALWYPDGLDERLEVSAEQVTVARRVGDRERELQGHNWCVLDLLEAGNIERVDAHRAEHARLADELRLPGFQWWSHTWAAMRAMLEGRYQGAREELERLRAIAERIGDHNAELFHRLGLFHLEFEDQELSDEMLAFGIEQAESSPASYAYRGALACVFVWQGRRDEARRQLALLAENDFAAIRPDMNRLASTADLAVAAWHLDDRATAAGIYERARHWSGRLAIDGRAFYCYGSLDLFLGMLATVLGRYEEAEAHFGLALRHNERIGAAPWLAHARARYGEMLLRRGRAEDTAQGEQLIAQAAADVRALGLTRTAREFESALATHR